MRTGDGLGCMVPALSESDEWNLMLPIMHTISFVAPQQQAKVGNETLRVKRVIIAFIFLLPFSAQNSHVKPLNHLTHYHPTTSAWHFSYAQPAILDIETKTREAPGNLRG
jgi:hypothetical protein